MCFFPKFIHLIEIVVWIYDTFDNNLCIRNVGSVGSVTSVLINISL